MTRKPKIAFVGTSRSGLGHLRRLSTIAQHVAHRAPGAELSLITNAQPEGMPAADLRIYGHIITCPRGDMARLLAKSGVDLAIMDTLQVPGIDAFPGAAALILRETPASHLASLARDDGKPWDRVIVPNPANHWMPAVGPGFATSIAAAGWILRPTGPRQPGDKSAGIVVATGGGGTADTRAHLYPLLDDIIARARRRTRSPFVLRHTLGPRAGGAALSEADAVFDPGGALNAVFRTADLVISTAGYNSVLELASTDTPTLLAAIPRSLDDQAARVRLWGPKLGHGLDPAEPDAAAAWLAGQIDRPRRRAPVDLGPDGAARAAELVLETLCPVS